MSHNNSAVAGVLVFRRGSKRALVGRTAATQVLGPLGAMVGARKQARIASDTPLASGQCAYLAVTGTGVALFATRGGLVTKFKPSDSVIATVPRAATTFARLDEGRLWGGLELAFSDGTSWEFDVERKQYKGARQVVASLTGQPGGWG
ncbi:MAG: hypothetical protein ACRD29_09965 [Acidimicrobiales bacterium]